jgi:putative PIN family toxin of toxin-antitoxin system
LVSAFIAAGPPSRVLERAIDGALELVLADPVLAELQRVLVSKLSFEVERYRDVERLLSEIAVESVAAVEGEVPRVSGDPDDDRILACAVKASVDVLVSGDRKHLLPLGSHKGVRIVTPQALLAELRSS